MDLSFPNHIYFRLQEYKFGMKEENEFSLKLLWAKIRLEEGSFPERELEIDLRKILQENRRENFVLCGWNFWRAVNYFFKHPQGLAHIYVHLI